MKLGQIAADLTTDLGRAQRELLVGTLGVDLKGPGVLQALAQVGLGGLLDLVHIIGTEHGLGDRVDAEDADGGLQSRFHIDIGIHGLDIDGRLHIPDIKLADALHTVLDRADQLIFKAAAIEALKDQLAALEQQYFLHCVSPIGGVN